MNFECFVLAMVMASNGCKTRERERLRLKGKKKKKKIKKKKYMRDTMRRKLEIRNSACENNRWATSFNGKRHRRPVRSAQRMWRKIMKVRAGRL